MSVQLDSPPLVPAVIAASFLGDVARIDLTIAVAVAFIATMLTLILGLMYVLRQVNVATAQLLAAPRPDRRWLSAVGALSDSSRR
jgi:hypothetical protein